MAVLVARLSAQDVSISPMSWVYREDPPDQFPAPKRPCLPEFPDELLKTADFGYVTEDVFVDDRGKRLSVEYHATIPVYDRELLRLEASSSPSFKSFSPATRDGKPVNSRVHFSVVFNPASARASGPDATPRLLDAWPVVVPKMKAAGDDTALFQKLMWATVTLDEQGHPTAVKDAPAEMTGLLENAVKSWQFAPARRAGRAVAQDARVPFILIAENHGLAKNRTPPRVVRQVAPTYPYSMRLSRMRGEVQVQFIVDIEGNVRRPFVVRSLNPAFDEPATEAVGKWRFEPGREDGVPVYTTMQVPVFFALNGLEDGGSAGIELRRGGNPSKLPEEWRVDVPAKIRSIVMPVYPYEMLKGDVTGSAEVSYAVDEQGRVGISLVTRADRPEFGLALQAAVERFEYEPALKNGRPNKSLLGFGEDFRTNDARLVTGDDDRILGLERKHPEKIGSSKNLDQPLKAVVKRAPVFPRSLLGRAARGDALVELLVDEVGHPRLERVVSASEPAFGYAAVQAAALWLFASPVSKGQGIVVRVRIPFVFGAGAPGSADSTPP